MRVDQFAVSVTIDDRPLGIFDVFDGGETDSEETKYKPGGMQPQKSLGGSTTTENVTLRRLYDKDRGDPDLVRWLRTRAGKGRSVVAKQPLDVDGNPFGKADVYTGTLKRVAAPGHDSEDSGPALFELEVSTEGSVG